MFHPNLSNRGKANFIVGVVVLVSLFWLIGSWTSSSRSSKKEQIVSETGGDLKQDRRTSRIKSSRMASNSVVELHRDMDLLSPALPQEIERRRETIVPTEGTLDVDVSTVYS